MSLQFQNGTTYGATALNAPDQVIVDTFAIIHADTANTTALTLGSGGWDVIVNGKVLADNGHGINLKDAGVASSQVALEVGAEVIAGGATGIGINAAHATDVFNYGTIRGSATGINESGAGDVSMLNNGIIEGGRYGLHFSFSGEHQMFNFGTITGGEYGILGEDGIEQIVNTGTVNGNVHLGDGNDVFANVFGGVLNGTVNGTIDLGKGDDTFFGGANREIVRDGEGKDSISFGGGNDHWFGFLAGGDDGMDTVDGGAGVDTYDATQSGVQGVAINLDKLAHSGHAAFSADDFNAATAGEAITGFENVNGTEFKDFLYGSSGNNVLSGFGGNDVIFGGSGNDTLYGYAGVDTLTGGAGKDKLYGGVDRDIFDFNSIKESVKGSNRDTIYDFQRGIDDIDLRTIDAKSGSGNNAFKFIGTKGFHHVKGELHYKDYGSKCLVSGDVNGDGKADFEIMVHAAALNAHDFLL